MALGSLVSSLSVAVEKSYAMLNDGVKPDPTSGGGLTWTAVNDISRESITYDDQEQPTVPLDIAHGAMGQPPDLPATIYESGTPVARRTGQPNLKFKGLQCPGAGVALSTLTLVKVLRTVMACHLPSAGTSDTVGAGSHTVNAFVATDATKYGVGRKIAFTIDGRVEFTWVSNISGSNITVSPALSAAPAEGDTVRMCGTFYPQLGALTFTDCPSIALRQDMIGRRWVAYGCRLKTLTLEMDGTTAGPGGAARLIMPTAKLWSPWVVDDDGSASPQSVGASGPYAMGLQGYEVWSSLVAVSTPADAARNVLEARKWSVEIDFDLVPRDSAGNGIGFSDYACNGVNISIKQTLAPNSTFAAALNAREIFHLLFGAGPTSAGLAGRGMGFAFGAKAACLAGFAKPTVSVKETMQELTWRLAPYSLETGTWSPGSAPDAPFTLAWVS